MYLLFHVRQHLVVFKLAFMESNISIKRDFDLKASVIMMSIFLIMLFVIGDAFIAFLDHLFCYAEELRDVYKETTFLLLTKINIIFLFLSLGISNAFILKIFQNGKLSKVKLVISTAIGLLGTIIFVLLRYYLYLLVLYPFFEKLFGTLNF